MVVSSIVSVEGVEASVRFLRTPSVGIVKLLLGAGRRTNAF